jgi:hypothetical protein
MTKLSKIVAPLALFAAFGVAQAGEVTPADLSFAPVKTGTAQSMPVSANPNAGGELSTGDLSTMKVSAGTAEAQMAGKRTESAVVIGA